MNISSLSAKANQYLKQPLGNTPRQHDVSEDTIMAAATQMAGLGFRHNDSTIKMLEAYLGGHALYVWGDVGQSKTYFFQTLTRIGGIKDFATGRTIWPSFKVIPMMGLADKKIEDISEFLVDTIKDELLIDDVGAEAMPYGIEPLPLILQAREHSSARTHITTNLSEQDLFNRYKNTRIIDRLRDGRVRIHCTGTSYRSANNYTGSNLERARYEEIKSGAQKRYAEEHWQDEMDRNLNCGRDF